MSETNCPRCHPAFHCGAQEAHCPCFDLHLTPALRADLAARYAGCLCLPCLQELAAQQATRGPMPSSTPKAPR
ncbi:hypothetical protein HNQ51_000526 [Inhella inkyongensis]|uniref:Cysteine-rich CWC n=1 Tax=Inhella inkyongensis TaxID=392593 RepID=A0A840S0B9_9BURK|nr:cysteine-rich CWC family protein [Inhella inkyongensis]MBB5203233.1 hypothetical protein [Inhella inkyongensis]